MKHQLKFLLTIILFTPLFILAQQHGNNKLIIPPLKFQTEVGINCSVPLHDDLWRTHTLAIGCNAAAFLKTSSQIQAGLRMEYEYRFSKKHYQKSWVKNGYKHGNFSMLIVKTEARTKIHNHWSFGAGAGIGFVKLEGDNTTGFGFVEEYDGCTPIGFCSGVYASKYFDRGSAKNKWCLSVYWSGFYAEVHGENFGGLRFNYIYGK